MLIVNKTKVATKPIEISTKMCYVYANLAIAIAEAKSSCYIYLFSTKAY